jgi:hypothetical protein
MDISKISNVSPLFPPLAAPGFVRCAVHEFRDGGDLTLASILRVSLAKLTNLRGNRQLRGGVGRRLHLATTSAIVMLAAPTFLTARSTARRV